MLKPIVQLNAIKKRKLVLENEIMVLSINWYTLFIVSNVYLSRETMILMTEPAFDNTVSASTNEIFVKSTPSTSKILSLIMSFPYADDCFSTSLINIPCVPEKKRKNCQFNWISLKY